jgi:dipeptidyl aminopeptidase/acylaminoacyl peptidase
MPAAAIANGTKIAFTRGENILICTYPDVRKVTKIGQGQDPSLSGDGKLVAFEEQSTGNERTFAIREAATGKLVVRHAGTRPLLSPDSQQVAFSLFSNSKWSLWSSDLPLKSPRNIGGTGKNGPAFGNGWVKDLIIAHPETFNGSLYALHPDGTVAKKAALSQIAAGKDYSIPLGCAWSDDFNQVVLEAMTGESRPYDDEPQIGLYLYDLRTGKPRRLTPKGMDGSGPVWYGSSTIVFSGSRGGTSKKPPRANIYTLAVGSGAITPLIEEAYCVALAAT